MNRRLRVPGLALMASVLSVMSPLPAAADTPGIDRLEKAGWTCFDFGELGIHCWNEPSSGFFGPDGPISGVDGPISVPMRVFTVDQDGNETYEGAELLIRADVFERNPNRERPCPQEGDHWHDLEPGFGLSYYGCHRFD